MSKGRGEEEIRCLFINSSGVSAEKKSNRVGFREDTNLNGISALEIHAQNGRNKKIY